MASIAIRADVVFRLLTLFVLLLFWHFEASSQAVRPSLPRLTQPANPQQLQIPQASTSMVAGSGNAGPTVSQGQISGSISFRSERNESARDKLLYELYTRNLRFTPFPTDIGLGTCNDLIVVDYSEIFVFERAVAPLRMILCKSYMTHGVNIEKFLDVNSRLKLKPIGHRSASLEERKLYSDRSKKILISVRPRDFVLIYRSLIDRDSAGGYPGNNNNIKEKGKICKISSKVCSDIETDKSYLTIECGQLSVEFNSDFELSFSVQFKKISNDD